MNTIRAWLENVRDTEPARWAELARLLLVAGVGLGWLTIDSDTANAIVSIVSLLASILLTRWVRTAVYSRRTVARLMRRTPRPARRRPSVADVDPAADMPQDPPPAPTPA